MVSNDALLRVTPKSAAAPVRNGERTGKFAQWEKQDLLAVAEEGVLLLTDLDGRTAELEKPPTQHMYTTEKRRIRNNNSGVDNIPEESGPGLQQRSPWARGCRL